MTIMKKSSAAFCSALVVVVLGTLPAYAEVGGVPMWRMYNPNSGEHFYTADTNERDSLCGNGWASEGIGWVAPTSGNPIYRLYNNPRAGSNTVGDHHYTANTYERDMLVKRGWKYEGVGWYSDTNKRIPMYRQYNPNVNSENMSGSHNYTANSNERDSLIRIGWQDEGIAWYAVSAGSNVSVQGCTTYSGMIWRNPTGGCQPALRNYAKLSIDVDVARQRVYIKSNGTIIYTMVVSTGLNGSTPKGNYSIRYRGLHFYNANEGMGGDYWVGFIGTTYLFHSVPTRVRQGDYIVSEANKLGQPASHGCVRLSVADAQWFYQQVPDGTPVRIY